MDPYQETHQTWNRIAGLYQDTFMDLSLYNASYDLLCDLLPAEQVKILEVGCGPGNICRYLLRIRPDLIILGTDVAPNMVALAAQNNPGARFLRLDLRELSGLSERFDALVSGFCLPYLDPDAARKFFTDAHNLLHKSGLLYLSFVEGPHGLAEWQEGSSGDRSLFRYFEMERVSEELQDLGFSMVKILKVEYTKANRNPEQHNIILARKA